MGSMNVRDAIEYSMVVLMRSPVTTTRDAALETLRAILDQVGCEEYEGHPGLCETCDVAIYG